MNKTLMYGFLSIIGVAILIVIACVYWLVRPYNILSFSDGNGTFIETTVKSGGYLQMHQNSCKYVKIISEVNRQFIDSIVYQVPPSTNDRPMGCSERIEYIYIPKALPTGEYHIRTVITFSVNPIRKVSYTVITEPFTIVK